MATTKKNANDDVDGWMGLLGDADRADVIKVGIAEREKTARALNEETARTQRELIATEGYHVVRGLFVIMLLAAVGGGTCVGYHVVELRKPASAAP